MMSRLIVLVVLLLTIPLEEAKKRKRSGDLYSYQSVNNGGGVQVVDVVKGTRGSHTFQSIDSNGNVQSSSVNVNLGNTNAGNVRIVNVNGNRLVLDLSNTNNFNNNYDDYYDNDTQNKDPIILHYAQLMNNFITPISILYNADAGNVVENSNMLQYIFIHYYSGKVVSPYVIDFLPGDLTQCPLVEYCLKETRPLCIGSITYCVSPMRKTATCLPQFKNELPCLTTAILNKNKREEQIVVPCITSLTQTGTKKKYCVTTIVVNTHIKETMQKVQRTVKNSMERAQQAIQNGLNAGRLGLQRGMETMRKALGGFRNFKI